MSRRDRFHSEIDRRGIDHRHEHAGADHGAMALCSRVDANAGTVTAGQTVMLSQPTSGRACVPMRTTSASDRHCNFSIILAL